MHFRKAVDRVAGTYRMLLHARRANRRFPLPLKLTGSYLISSELGIAHVVGDVGRFLTCWSGYGMAIHGSEIYVVDESAANVSRVVSLPLSEFMAAEHFLPFGVWKRPSLYEQPYRSTNGRIHQLTISGGRLLVAASEMNAIVEIDLTETVSAPRLTYPFKDQFGAPIKNFDHNHINSVIGGGDGIFFVAYKASESSLIGLIRNERLLGWRVFPQGYHDLYNTDTGFITCDTFGNAEAGRIVTEQGQLLSEYFAMNKLAPRGVARSGDEWLFGHSHKGPRAKRFKGKGAIVVKTVQGEVVYCELPCAQVYQILRTDGRLLSNQAVDLQRVLSDAFGQPEELGPVTIEPTDGSHGSARCARG